MADRPMSQTQMVLQRIGASGVYERNLLTGQESIFGHTVDRWLTGTLNKQTERMHAVTYACMSRRAEAVSSVPLRVYRGDRNNPTEVTSGPLFELAEDPNPYLSRAEYWTLLQQLMDARGYCIVLKGPTPEEAMTAQIPRELWPQDPVDYRPEISNDGLQVIGFTNNRTTEFWPRESVMVHRFMTRLDPLAGLAPMEVASITTEADYLASRYQRNFVANDCNPSAWAVTEKMLTDPQFEAMANHLRDQMQGTENVGGIKLLENIHQFVFNPTTHRDMQFLEGREAMLEEIALVYGVPKSLLGKTGDVNRATAMTQKAIFWENTILPLLRLYEDGWWRWLSEVDGGAQWVEFDTSGVIALQRDLAERVDMFTKLATQGVPMEEAARVADVPLESFAGDDTGLVQSSLMPIEMVSAQDDVAEVALDVATGDEPQELTPQQMQQVLAIVAQVQSGALPADSAKVALELAYPLSSDQIDALIDPAATSDTPPSDEGLEDAEETDADSEEEPDDGRGQSLLKPHQRLLAARKKRAARLAAYQASLRSITWQSFEEGVVIPRGRVFGKKTRALLRWARQEILKQFDALTVGPLARADSPEAATVLTQDDVLNIGANQQEWDRLADLALREVYRDVIIRSAATTYTEIGLNPLQFNVVNPKWVRYINERLGEKIADVNKETTAAIQRTIRNGLINGDTIAELREGLIRDHSFSRARARTIAITEVNGTANNTRWDTFGDGDVAMVSWQASTDGKTRTAHLINARHEPIPRGEKFPSGARYPHDPEADAKDVVNCRCGILAAPAGPDGTGLEGLELDYLTNEEQAAQDAQEAINAAQAAQDAPQQT